MNEPKRKEKNRKEKYNETIQCEHYFVHTITYDVWSGFTKFCNCMHIQARA